jgi:fluoroacetyl-CoA thioesterase
MKPTLRPGLRSTFRYRVPENKTVPKVYSESEHFQAMPRVFATAYFVGLVEWACLEAMLPHLDSGEQSVGTAIHLTHTAATPPGFTVTVEVVVEQIEGQRVAFSVKADDGADTIGEGTHERFIIDRARFDKKLEHKTLAAAAQPHA